VTADEDLQFMSDGVINLDYSVEYGRSVTVRKLRGSAFRLGEHSAKIDDNGLHVFPRLLPSTFPRTRLPPASTSLTRCSTAASSGASSP
jgi:circadian clock protein KaiC